MKKILSLLMSLTVTSSATIAVVSCSPKMHKITTKFAGTLKETDYDESALYDAYNGTAKTPYGAAAAAAKNPELLPLNGLTFRMINLLGFNASMVTNANKIANWRKLYIGNDDSKEGLRNIPSVDGVFFGQKVEGKTPEDFYKNYKKTNINSLAGLYQLYTFNQEGQISEDVIGAGAQASLAVIKETFTGAQSAATGFFNSFLNLTSHSQDSSWVSQTLTSELAKAKLDSEVLSFNEKVEGTGSEETKTLQFTPDGAKKDLGTVQKYNKINSKVDDETPGKIGNNPQAPFDLFMLPTDSNIKTEGQVEFDTSWQYPDDEHKDSIDGSKTWAIRKPDDQDGWKVRATTAPIGKDKKQTGYIKTNESIIVPVKPLTIKYVYTTNIRDSKATRYEVAITFENIQAVFRPRIASSAPKDADKDSTGNRYVKWQFTHYQFNDTVDTTTLPGQKEADKPQKGYYSGMKISKLAVKELKE